MIDTSTTSALILEDDADWDVNIHSQILPIASAIRSITNTTASPITYPYGADWDILWLGHCGDIYDTTLPSNIAFHDQTVLPSPSLKSVWLNYPYATYPNYTRNVHYSQGAMCTFGYAVTLTGARKIQDLASSSGEAYDVKLNHLCVKKELVCMSVVPELVHHQRMEGAKSLSSGGSERLGTRRWTHNIRHSARCNWDRRNDDLVTCAPNSEEWEAYSS